MHGIYITAVLTTGLAVLFFGTLIHKLRLPASERLLWMTVLFAVPLQPIAFYFVRVPIDYGLASHFGYTSAAYRWIATLYAPITEEAAKLLPLCVPVIRRDINPGNFARYAVGIGLGFAIGEMWFVAERGAGNSRLASLPFYQFGGYAMERLMTCVFHSAFVSVALWRLRRGFAWGVAGAMAMHWIGNFPIILMSWNIGAPGRALGEWLVQLWLVFYFVASLALLSRFTFGRLAVGNLLYGRRLCPECGKDFDASIIGLNYGSTRYERCPHCRRWLRTRPARKAR